MPQELPCPRCGVSGCTEHRPCVNCGDHMGVDDFCSDCERCNDCCCCGMCSQCGEHHPLCSDCDCCLGNCCHCWTCPNQGCNSRRTASTQPCTICGRCNYCDTCRDCVACSTRVSNACVNCGRCQSCECNCPGDMCELCHHRGVSCFCMNCHIIDPNTGIITDTHRYNPNSGDLNDVRCMQCGLCQRHCSAATCACGNKQHGLCEVCGKCASCCRCYFCHRGTRHFVEGGREVACLTCGYCMEHCSCPKCKDCGQKGRGFCQFCQKCKACCTAETSECGCFGRSERIPFEKREFTIAIPNRKQLRRLPNPRPVGVEIEVNNYKDMAKPRRLYEALKKWNDSVVSDGSIGGGFELNLAPAGGDLLLEHLEEVAAGLAMIKAAPNEACGVHVHVDASDFSVWDLNKVVQIYAKVERALFDVCHPRRLENTYCKPCARNYLEGGVLTKPAEFKSKLVGQLYMGGRPARFSAAEYMRRNYGKTTINKNDISIIKRGAQQFVQSIKDKKKHKYESVRYYALNLHSYFLRGKEVAIGKNKTFVGGTIEFRHHQEAVDYEELSGWAQVCQELVSSAASMTQAQILALPRNSRRNLIAVMPQRLHPYIIDRWHKHDDLLAKNSTWRARWESQWGTKFNPINSGQIERKIA